MCEPPIQLHFAATVRPRRDFKLIGVIALTALMGTLVWKHVEPLNGPWYWEWHWRRLPVGPVSLLLGCSSIPVLIGFFFAGTRRLPMWAAIGLIMLGSIAMRFAGAAVLSDPISFDFVRRATADPLIGSYYSSAAKIAPLDNILSLYWELLNWDPAQPHLDFHAVNKPPGPVLYHLIFIRAMGDTDAAALWSGLWLGILATLAIPCTYLSTRRITESGEAALIACACLALAPGFLLFFPMTDPVFPIFTCLLTISWFSALRDDRWLSSLMFGLGLCVATFVTYNVLVIGVFLAGMIWVVPRDSNGMKKLHLGVKHSAIALGACIAAYLSLYLVFSFNPVVTFFAAYKAQMDLIATSPRSHIFPQTIPWDLYDFLLGAGWIIILPLSCWIARLEVRSVAGRVAILAILQIVVTAATGLLQAETARVWNFLLPLMLLPAGMGLSTWAKWKVVLVLACVALLTILIHVNMTFINEG